MKYLLVILLLAGCSNEDYRKADSKVLCDPDTKEAYFVQAGGGTISYVSRNKNLDKVCINVRNP